MIKRANCTDQGAFFILLEPPLVRPFSSITMAPYTGFPNLNHNAMASVSRTLWDWLQRFLRLVKMSVCFRPTCLHRLVPFWCFSYHLPLACHCRIDPMPLFECLLSFHSGVCGNRGNGHEREGLVDIDEHIFGFDTTFLRSISIFPIDSRRRCFFLLPLLHKFCIQWRIVSPSFPISFASIIIVISPVITPETPYDEEIQLTKIICLHSPYFHRFPFRAQLPV